jgi:hypothetical protein
MFMHCPHCQSLVATDAATGIPPRHCPRCGKPLDGPEASPSSTGDDADAGEVDEARSPHNDAVAETVAATPPPETAPENQPAAVETGTDPSKTDDEATPVPASAEPEKQTGEADGSEAVGDEVMASNASLNEEDEALGPESVATLDAVVDTAADAAGMETQEDEADRADPAPDDAVTDYAATTLAPGQRSTKPAPRFAQVRAPAAASHGQNRWRLPALIAGLAMLLALQWALADRERLAADARWRPLVVQLCGVLRCSVPPWREPSAFVLLDRDVRPHPRVPGELRVTASFRNDASWAQAWPEVELTLSDLEGRAVGTRRFSAHEYLGATPTQETLASGQTATIRLEVIEPSPRSVAFAFDFR